MKRIETIEDFHESSWEEVEDALEQVTILPDLRRFLKWLNSPEGGKIHGTFSLGYQARGLGLHPSSLAKKGTCKLKHYYEATGEVEAFEIIDMDLQLIFDLGTLIHCMFQTFFLEMYGEERFEEEVGLSNGKLLLKSHADGKFDFSLARFMLEIKSVKEGGNFGFEKIQDKPFPDNVRQLHCYMFLADVPFGLLFYFCKNNSKTKEHAIHWDEDIWLSIDKEIRDVLTHIKERNPPKGKKGWHCKRCAFYRGCPEQSGRRLGSGTKKRRGKALSGRRKL